MSKSATPYGSCTYCPDPAIVRIRAAIGHNWWQRLVTRHELTVCEEHIQQVDGALRAYYSEWTRR